MNGRAAAEIKIGEPIIRVGDGQGGPSAP